MDTVFDFNMVFPKVTVENKDTNKHTATFHIDPLERGFGLTVGNALRRIALSSLPGGAVKKIFIKGVKSEFDVLDTIVEDITSVVLSVKELNIRIDNQDEDFVLYLKSNKKGALTAGDIETPLGVEVINKDLHICTLAEDKEFYMELHVNKGIGYVLAEENRGTDKQPEQIYVDSIYTPVVKFSYNVVDTRVGDRIDFDKLVIEVETNGMLTPEEALSYAANIMMKHMDFVVNLEDNIKNSKVFTEIQSADSLDTDDEDKSKFAETSIETLDISNRAYNALKRANINTIEELSKKTKKEISTIDNVGSKTIEEIEKHIEDLGFTLK